MPSVKNHPVYFSFSFLYFMFPILNIAILFENLIRLNVSGKCLFFISGFLYSAADQLSWGGLKLFAFQVEEVKSGSCSDDSDDKDCLMMIYLKVLSIPVKVISFACRFTFHLAIESAPIISFFLSFQSILRPWSRYHFHNGYHPKKSFFSDEVLVF